MVKFSLICDQAHSFEGWFQNNDSFEAQRTAEQIICPVCASASVRKALMAPNLSTPKTKARIAERAAESISEEAGSAASSTAMTPPAEAAPSAGIKPAASAPAQMAQMMQMARTVRKFVEDNCKNVGPAFAEEARKMHNGDIEAEPIYGTSTEEEREELAEDGIAFAELPELPPEQ